jgi:hypothetical protein
MEKIIPTLVTIDKVNSPSKFNETDTRTKITRIKAALADLQRVVKELTDKSQTDEREKKVEDLQKALFNLQEVVNQADYNAYFTMLINNMEIYELIEKNQVAEKALLDEINRYITFAAFLKVLPAEYQDTFNNLFNNELKPGLITHRSELVAYSAFDVFKANKGLSKFKTHLTTMLETANNLKTQMFEINDKLYRWSIETEEIAKKDRATGTTVDWKREFDKAVEIDGQKKAGAASASLYSTDKAAQSEVANT